MILRVKLIVQGIVPSGNFTYTHEKMVPGPFASMMFDNLY